MTRTSTITIENQAMLIVAEQTAKELGYIETSKHTINALRDSFWGNIKKGIESDRPLEVAACKYILPLFEDEGLNYYRKPKIWIDMHWGSPRLSICRTDGTFCCLTYKDGGCAEAQAFGEKGLELALSVKSRIDYLIKINNNDSSRQIKERNGTGRAFYETGAYRRDK